MRALRSWFSALYFLSVAPYCAAQSAAPHAELPKDPKAVLAMAAKRYDFNDPSLKPWHLKATYQLYDENGNPTEQGTFEYWWASPLVYRSTWTRGASSYTEWHTADGKFAYLSTGSGLAFFESRLKAELLSPLGDAKDYDPASSYLDKEEVKFGKVKVPCIMVVPKMPNHGQLLNVPLGLFPTYCFDPEVPVLFGETSFGALQVLFGNQVLVQDRYLAKSVNEVENGKKVLTASVETIEGMSPTDSALVPPPDAKKPPVEAVQVDQKIMNAQRIGGPMPVYPQDAKNARAEGTVTLKALIGQDGRIHDLKVVTAPFPSLVQSAMWAVSHWEYKPYLLNGDPVAVETTIKVTFRLGG